MRRTKWADLFISHRHHLSVRFDTLDKFSYSNSFSFLLSAYTAQKLGPGYQKRSSSIKQIFLQRRSIVEQGRHRNRTHLRGQNP